jgi:hypothetical protein
MGIVKLHLTALPQDLFGGAETKCPKMSEYQTLGQTETTYFSNIMKIKYNLHNR